MKKRLYKDKENAIISGVLSGIGRYLGIDKTIVRIIYVTLTIFSWFMPLIILYFVLSWIMPDEEELGYGDYEIK